MTKKDKRYFQLAKAISMLSQHYKFKVGAVLVYKNKLLSVGANTIKSHPMQKYYDKERGFKTHHGCHAEVKAIINSKLTNLRGCSIYVYRELKNGQLANSRPCSACIRMIRDYGIRKIFYTTDNGFCEEILV